MIELIENIEIVFKLCRKIDAVCIHEKGNEVIFTYDEKKTASFTMTERKRDDYLIEIYCQKGETAFFANEFVKMWERVVDQDFQIGNVYGNL